MYWGLYLSCFHQRGQRKVVSGDGSLYFWACEQYTGIPHRHNMYRGLLVSFRLVSVHVMLLLFLVVHPMQFTGHKGRGRRPICPRSFHVFPTETFVKKASVHRSDVFPWHYNQYTLTALVTLLSTGHSLDGPSFHWSLSASIWPQLLTTCHSLDGQDCWWLSPLITWSLFWPLVTFLPTGHSLDNWPFPWPLVRLQHLTTSLYR